MKERPILFSAPMVRAILAGNKTQTRRVVKDVGLYAIEPSIHGHETSRRELAALASRCPYGQPGDRLWVRETFCPDWSDKPIYKADGGSAMSAGYAKEPRWRPSIHMPRCASRLTLEITGIRVERLQDISEADARAEGARCADEATGREVLFPSSSNCGSYRLHYRDIWDQINGPGSWEANPWVWVVEFRRSIDAVE